MNDKYEYGQERDLFTDMEPEELLILAAIGLHHIKEEAENLRATEQNRIYNGFEHVDGKKPNKQQIKEAHHMSLQYYARRNSENKAKCTAMTLYGRFKNLSMHKMMNKLKAEHQAKQTADNKGKK